MSCDIERYGCYSWAPGDEMGLDHQVLDRLLHESMEPERAEWWLCEIDRLSQRRGALGIGGHRRLVQQICKYDAPELVELLFPRYPQWFLGPVKEREKFNAVSLCAYHGSIASLEALLSLGADPNNLDCPDAWQDFTYFNQDGQETLFTCTPLDLARTMEQDECAFLLELYGGMTARELFQTPETAFPPLVPAPQEAFCTLPAFLYGCWED